MPRHFLLRRFHSLAGVVSLGVFLLGHLWLLGKALSPQGINAYNSALLSMREAPFSGFFCALLVYLPLAFHAVYGFALLYEGKSNATAYGYGPNFRYTLQRAAFVVGVLFLAFHFVTLKIALSGAPADYMALVGLFQAHWRGAVYALGAAALFYYFFNGIWNFLITWGITLNRRSQKRAGLILSVLGLAGFLVSALIILNFTYHYEPAPKPFGPVLERMKNA